MPVNVNRLADRNPDGMNREEQRKQNLRLALILGSVAVVFFLGFVAKMVLFGGK